MFLIEWVYYFGGDYEEDLRRCREQEMKEMKCENNDHYCHGSRAIYSVDGQHPSLSD